MGLLAIEVGTQSVIGTLKRLGFHSKLLKKNCTECRSNFNRALFLYLASEKLKRVLA